ncbi:MAG: four helix bundle protein [Candidatus Cloacimonetes bacterium]|nr:four helix bundle protein [Candidatus Cloacimonadota bacterium]
MIHKDLDAWKVSITLVKEIYLITRKLPKDELYGLISQIRRCAVSIPSNIAEGAARNSNKEYIRFLNISAGSLAELDTQLIISNELGYINKESYNNFAEQISRISRLIQGLIKYLNRKE